MGSQDDSKSQDRFLGLIKDCKSSGSSLQMLPVLNRKPGWLRKSIQQYYKKLATFLGHPFILADLPLAEQLYRILNKRAPEQPTSMTETEEWEDDTEILPSPFSAVLGTARVLLQKLSCTCASIFSFTSGLCLLLQQVQ